LKLLTTIFAFYILALSTIPCCVFDNCPEDQIETTYLTTEHESSDDDGCGTCSPFFNCGSCTVGFTNYVTYTSLPKQQIFASDSKKYSYYKQTFNTNFSSTIWQPPKNNV